MRVLWISSSFPPGHGGLQGYNDALSRALAERVDLTVVSGPGQRPSARAPHVECPALAGFPGESGWKDLEGALRPLASEADLVHLGHAQMAVVRPFLPEGVPVVVSVHGNDLTSPWMQFGLGDLRPLLRSRLPGCHLVCVSRHTASLAADLDCAVTVLPNACDLDRFRPLDFDRAAFRRRLGLPLDVPLVLTAGRIASRKDHLNVLRALRGLDLPFHWLVAGGGAERTRLALARLLQGMARRVSMPGWLDEDDLVRAYNAADLFVLTPRERTVRGGLDSEGFGLVYHEAAACGTPSVASDVSGCREAVLHGETGLLVPPAEPETLRAAIRQLLADEPRRRRLGEAALAHVRAQGGWPAVADRLVGLYRSLVPAG